MERIKKINTSAMERITFQPGNMTRYDLLIGVITSEDEEPQVALMWLNRKGAPSGLFSRWDLRDPEEVGKRLGRGRGDGAPLTTLMLEYLDRRPPLATLLDSADPTGCSDDLTVVSREALDALRSPGNR